MKLIYIF